jgi:hypothetical protein
MSVQQHEIDRRTERRDETERHDPMTIQQRNTEIADAPIADSRTLSSIVSELQQKGAERIRLVVEDEAGRQRTESGHLLLEVTALYDHWGLEEGLRRRLEAVDQPIMWGGDEWELEAHVGERTDPDESITLYDRFR